MLLAQLALALAVTMATATTATEYPPHWGEPPSMGLMDYRPLPGGYGHGSSTAAAWIRERMAEDLAANKVQYPPAFGRPPARQTRDLRSLPFGYAHRASGTIATWLAESAEKFHGETAAEFSSYTE